jgi:filamentous hemagglutinin family protein
MSHASLNRVFRLVRDEVRGTWIAVHEHAGGHVRRVGGGRAALLAALRTLPALLALGHAQAAPPAAAQLPVGGQVVAGQAQIAQAGARMDVTQASARAVIDWQSFNLGSQAQLNFQQPSAGSVVLNRVLDGNASQIFGRITANGQVFLSNPAGIYFSPTAQADVGALVATTHGIGNTDFMAGQTTFTRQGATGSVVNEGRLLAQAGGYLALLAPEVRNSGVLIAQAGTVALAAGEAVELRFQDGRLAALRVSPSDIAALVENRQAVLAPGGQILMSAQAAQTLQGGVIRHSGSLNADSIDSRGGRIVLEAGQITLASGASVSARGATGGGEVRVGGDWQGQGELNQAHSVTMEAGASIDASATARGDGGSITLWSDLRAAGGSTRADGLLSARGGDAGGDGGRIETSAAHVSFGPTLRVDTRAGNGHTGRTGLWLIDPYDYTIGSTEAATLATALTSSNVTLTTSADVAAWGSSGNSAGTGDITVNSAISAFGTNALTLQAAGAVIVNAPIATGGLTLTGANGVRLGAALSSSADITINGNISLLSDITLSSGSSQTFTTGGSFVVPAGATSVTAQLVGGAGGVGGADGAHLGGDAGRVGSVTATFAVTAGQTLYVAPGSAGAAGPDNTANLPGGAGGTNAFGLAGGGTGGYSGPQGSSGSGGGGGAASMVALTAAPTTSSALLIAGGGGGGGGSGNNNACPSLCAGQAVASYRSDGSMNGQTGANAGNQTPSLNDGGGSGGGGGGLAGGLTSASVYFTNEWTGRGGNNGSNGAANTFATTTLSTSVMARSNGQDGYVRLTYGGGGITLNGSVDGAQALTLDAPAGRVALNGAVGAGTALSSLTATGLQGITLAGGSVRTTGSQTFAGPVTLNASQTTLTSSNAPVSLAGSVVAGNGQTGDLSISAGSGDVSFGDTVGSSGAPLGALSISSTGLTTLGGAAYASSLSKTGTGITSVMGGLVSTSGAQDYVGTVDLGGNTTLSSTSSGNIGLRAVSNISQRNLTVTAANGNVTVLGNLAVGTNSYNPTSIGDVSITASGAVTFGTSASRVQVDARNLNITANSLTIWANGTSPFTCNAAVSAYGICLSAGRVFNNAAASTVDGPMSGTGFFTKTGAGKLTLTTSTAGTAWMNNYTGATSISGGIVEITGRSALGRGNYLGNIAVASQLRFASLTNQILRGTMSGVGFINAMSTGTLSITTLGSANNYNVQRLYLLGGGSVYGDSVTPAYRYYTSPAGTTEVTNASITGTPSFTGVPTATSNAATYTLTYTGGLTLGNERYALPTGSTAAWVVAARPLTVTVSKTYDGSAGFSSGFQLSGMVNGNAAPTLTGSASVAAASAGSYSSFSSSTLALGNANYTLAGGLINASIGRASLGITTLTAQDKTYDGSTAATANLGSAQFSGRVGSDQVSLAATAASFDDKNVGPGKTVTVSGLTLVGADAGNYSLASTTAVTSAAITPASISAVTGITAADKVYDRTTAVTLNTGAAGFTGLFNGDQLTVATASGAFADKNVASGKTVAISGLTLSGTDAGNYTLVSSTATTTASITPASISAVTGIMAADKVYDRTTAATLSTGAASFTGLINGDQLAVTTASGSFTDKNAAAGKTVAISGLTLSGADAGNYTLASSTATTTASITPASISAITGITAVDKVYDRTTAATLSTGAASFTGLINGDQLAVDTASGSFANKNVANGKTVAISGLTLAGADAGNYTLGNSTATTTASITPASISTITGISAADKVYDGTTLAALGTSTARFAGLLAGDQLAVGAARGEFADKNAGQRKGHFSKPPSHRDVVSRQDGGHDHPAHQALGVLASPGVC